MDLKNIIEKRINYKKSDLQKVIMYLKMKYDITIYDHELDISALSDINPLIDKGAFIVLGRSNTKGLYFELSIKGYTTDQYNFNYINDYLIPVELVL